MRESISITVHPSESSGDYLTVSDALKQVLDLVDTLDALSQPDGDRDCIVWRLVEAHTNSPPFTAIVAGFPKDPEVSLSREIEYASRLFIETLSSVLEGRLDAALPKEAVRHLTSAFKRNLNGVGRTTVLTPHRSTDIVPTTAQLGLSALTRADALSRDDWQRVERGSIEGRVIAITQYYNSPALVIQERLTGAKVMCALNEDVAGRIGPEHRWSEAWSGEDVRVSGVIHYGEDGLIKRVMADSCRVIEWTDVSISDIKAARTPFNTTIKKHLEDFWS